MTLLYGSEAVRAHATPELALACIDHALDAEAAALAALSPRNDLATPSGFLRVMPGFLDGVMGLKVMTLVNGLGTRYVLLMHDVETGELLALFDAEELTRTRTAAMTAVAASAMVDTPPTSLGVIGSGFEAVGHVRMLASMWPLEHATVFSPNEARRERFAAALSTELGIPITPAASAAAAVAGQPCAVLATKSKTPVVDGAMFDPRCTVLSIGSTRLDLRELDVATFERAAAVVVDHAEQVMAESGDVAAAIEAKAITADQLIGVRELPAYDLASRPDRDLVVFKSVGTVLQDLALAQALHADPHCRAAATHIGELGELKPFAAQVDVTPSPGAV